MVDDEVGVDGAAGADGAVDGVVDDEVVVGAVVDDGVNPVKRFGTNPLENPHFP